MPLPVAHALVGATVAAAVDRKSETFWKVLLLSAFKVGEEVNCFWNKNKCIDSCQDVVYVAAVSQRLTKKLAQNRTN